jgi:hypothetical protein
VQQQDRQDAALAWAAERRDRTFGARLDGTQQQEVRLAVQSATLPSL